MIATAGTDTRLVRKVAAYLCHAEARATSTTSPHLFDSRYREIRRASGRRALLRNLEAASRPTCS